MNSKDKAKSSPCNTNRKSELFTFLSTILHKDQDKQKSTIQKIVVFFFFFFFFNLINVNPPFHFWDWFSQWGCSALMLQSLQKMISITSLGFRGNIRISKIQAFNVTFRHLTTKGNFSSHSESKLFISTNTRHSCAEQGHSGQATWQVSVHCDTLISSTWNLPASSVNEQRCPNSACIARRIKRLGQGVSTSTYKSLNHSPQNTQKKVFHEQCCLQVEVRSPLRVCSTCETTHLHIFLLGQKESKNIFHSFCNYSWDLLQPRTKSLELPEQEAQRSWVQAGGCPGTREVRNSVPCH